MSGWESMIGRVGAFVLCTALWGGNAGCASNPYSYDREYVPRSGESDFIDQAVPLTYEEVRREPAEHAQRLVSWFGTVTAVKQVGNQTLVSMDLRFHRERPLCRTQFDDSCRVTVSDRTGGPFSALVSLPAEARSGRDRLGEGSLVRVYGYPTEGLDDLGGPILQAAYFRYWPHGTYALTSSQNAMRQ